MRYARFALAILSLFLVTACQSAGGAVHIGPDPQAGQGFRFIAHVSGDFDGQAFAYATPVTALVKAHGVMTATVRAFPPPFLVLDGDANLIVEPIPGREAEAIQAVTRGDILIRRSGTAGALNRMGTIDAFKASFASTSAKIESAPPAFPPPEPVAADMPPAGPLTDVCIGTACIVDPVR